MGETIDSLSFRDESGLPHNWAENANCKGLNANLFHPKRGESNARALAVCVGCIVVEQCLHYALTNNIKVGVYGATSERQRRRMRSERYANTQS